MTIYNSRNDDNCQRCLPVNEPDVETQSVFADYFALAPLDNPNDITPGAPIAFPRGFSSDADAIARLSDSSFNIAQSGVYLVMFQVSVSGAAQLVLTLNGAPLSYTAFGSDAEQGQITGTAIVTTAAEYSVLSLINPINSANDVVITQSAGGNLPSSSHLTIVKLA